MHASENNQEEGVAAQMKQKYIKVPTGLPLLLVVPLPYTVPNPRTVVVELLHAVVAVVAV